MLNGLVKCMRQGGSRLTLYCACLGAISCLFSVVFPPASVKAETLRVGVILPLSGPAAYIGDGIRKGLETSAHDALKAGRLQFQFEDDAYQAARSLGAYRKLKSENCSAIIVFGSPAGSVLSSQASIDRIPLIVMSLLEVEQLQPKTGVVEPWIFKFFMTAQAHNDAVVEEVERSGFQTAAILFTDNEGLTPLAERFVSQLGDRVTVQQNVIPGDLDLRTVLRKLVASSPDVIYLLTLVPQTALAARSLKELRFTGQILGGLPADNPKEIETSGGALIGAKVVTHHPKDDRKSSVPPAALPLFKYSGEAWIGYDLGELISRAAVSGNTSREALRDFLLSTKEFAGILGAYSRVRPDTYGAPARMRKIESE